MESCKVATGKEQLMRNCCSCRHLLSFFACATLALVASPARTEPSPKDIASQASEEICLSGLGAVPIPGATPIASFGPRALNGKHMNVRDWMTDGGYFLRVKEFDPPDRPPLFFAAVYSKTKAPIMRLVRDSKCRLRGGERIETARSSAAPAPQRLVLFDAKFQHRSPPIPLNPKLPPPPTTRTYCEPVALLDNGVNYLLPEIARNLARDETGKLIGYDYWENDSRPFDFGVPDGDLDPRVSAFEPISHGTSVASVLLRDAEGAICIAPFRYAPHRRNADIGKIIDKVEKYGIRIVLITTGRSQPWPEFAQAIEDHPGVLFISASGNEDADLNKNAFYPMAYARDNHLVVAAANLDGSVWHRSNTGDGLVEIAVPAIGIEGIGFSGKPKMLSGTSFAAPRVAALAGILAQNNRNLDGKHLKMRILEAFQQIGHGTMSFTTLSSADFDTLLKKLKQNHQ